MLHFSGQNIVQKLRERVYNSVLKQEIAFFDKMKSGDLVTRLSSDTLLVGQSLTGNISDGLRSACQAVGGLGMMVRIHLFKFFITGWNDKILKLLLKKSIQVT